MVGVFLLWPVLFGFVASFTDYSPFKPHPSFIGLANYADLVSDPHFRSAFRTIGIFAASAVTLELLIGMVVAWLLREPFRGRGAVRVVLLLPWLVSPIGNGVMWHFLFESSAGIPNHLLALLGLPLQPSPLGLPGSALPATLAVEVWRAAPLAGFLLAPGFSVIPGELWEQATLDGVPLSGRLRHVVLPYLRPLLLAVAMLLSGAALGAFDSVLVLTHGGPGTETLTPALFSFQKAFQSNNWPLGAAAAWFIVAAVMILGGIYAALSRQRARR